MKFGVGQSVSRLEDPRLLTGQGCFTDDVCLPGQLHAAVLRSPVAHASIGSIDTAVARAADGVHAVYTADDIKTLGHMPCIAKVADVRGGENFVPERPVLARGRVRYVGQPMAFVVAESRAQARNAAELIEFEIDELPCVVELQVASRKDAPVLHPEHGSNVGVHFRQGNTDAVAKAMADAHCVVALKLVNNRLAPSPLEPRSCLATFDPEANAGAGLYTLYNPSQGAFAQQTLVSNAVLQVPREQVRVVSNDTGGGFGIRGEVQPEAYMSLFAAKALGAPVKWTGDRSEMFLTDPHGRDNYTHCSLALDRDGLIQALKIDTLANLGAYCTTMGPFVPTMAGGRITGAVYRIPHAVQDVRCVFTNTQPLAAYRGAGRPEACYVMERLIEAAAKQLGVSSIELRRKNYIRADEMPYENLSGAKIPSGDFSATMDLGLTQADVAGFAARKTESERDGKLRGLGLCFYTESSGGGPQEEARVFLDDEGGAEIVCGTYSHGQGHLTTFAQIVYDELGVDPAKVSLHQGDTEWVKFGGGTGGSRSSQMGGVAVLRACRDVVSAGVPVAAQLLQGAATDVEFSGGVFSLSRGEAGGKANSAAEVSLAEVNRAAKTREMGGDGATGLDETHRYERDAGWTFPNGLHVAEVEVDAHTGELAVVRYSAVDDCGRVLNPLLASGQVHGGVAMGLGQAVLEEVRYDPDSGQLLTGSMMDYCFPRASHLQDIDVGFHELAEPGNELGVKGIGEGGACGAPPAIIHAALDALSAVDPV